MASFTINAAPDVQVSDDDLDVRCQSIRQRLLDGIADTLDELARSDLQRAALADAVWARTAPLVCPKALCRRANRCRSAPCAVQPAARRSDPWRIFADSALSDSDPDAPRGY